MSRRLALLATAALLVGACGTERPAESAPPAPDSAALAAARAAAGALGSELLGMLTQALDQGGPAAAIGLCADSAQARTARHQALGVSVRRVGTRVRNSANAPDSIEVAVLAAFAAAQARGALPADTAFVVVEAGGSPVLHYLRPVLVAEPCLACHGDPGAIAPEVRGVIASRYPQDRAVGYRLGELRGAVSVRVAQ